MVVHGVGDVLQREDQAGSVFDAGEARPRPRQQAAQAGLSVEAGDVRLGTEGQSGGGAGVTPPSLRGTVTGSYRLLKLANPPQRRSLLPRAAGVAVVAVPPQLVTEVLHAVGLRLRTHLPLGEQRTEERVEERVRVRASEEEEARRGLQKKTCPPQLPCRWLSSSPSPPSSLSLTLSPLTLSLPLSLSFQSFISAFVGSFTPHINRWDQILWCCLDTLALRGRRGHQTPHKKLRRGFLSDFG